MILCLPPGVTIQGRSGCLSYACLGLHDRDLQIASNGVDLAEVDAAVDEPLAVGTDAAQVSGGCGHGNAVGHLSGWDFRRAAGDAIDAPWTARLLGALAALAQEPDELRPQHQGR